MEHSKEKFTIEVTEKGFVIRSGEDTRVEFTPVEALMLLDVLQNEESTLKRMAEEASPSPMRILL